MRLGAAEGRQFVVSLVLSIVLLAAYFAAALVAGLTMGIVAAALAFVIGGPVSQFIGMVLAIVAFLALWVPVAIRLSLAGPQTLDEGRIMLFDSWALTKGRVMSMLGAYMLSFILALVVTLLGLAVVLGAAAVLGGGMAGVATVFQPDTTSVASYFSPLMIVYIVMMSVISAMSLAITLTPPAVIYRSLKPGGSRADLDAFE